MSHYLILARVADPDLFGQYMKGHLPSIAQYGGRVVFRSTGNVPVLGAETWDAIAIQEWPSDAAFDAWWRSEEYRPWTKIRDRAARISIIRCETGASWSR